MQQKTQLAEFLEKALAARRAWKKKHTFDMSSAVGAHAEPLFATNTISKGALLRAIQYSREVAQFRNYVASGATHSGQVHTPESLDEAARNAGLAPLPYNPWDLLSYTNPESVIGRLMVDMSQGDNTKSLVTALGICTELDQSMSFMEETPDPILFSLVFRPGNTVYLNGEEGEITSPFRFLVRAQQTMHQDAYIHALFLRPAADSPWTLKITYGRVGEIGILNAKVKLERDRFALAEPGRWSAMLDEYTEHVSIYNQSSGRDAPTLARGW